MTQTNLRLFFACLFFPLLAGAELIFEDQFDRPDGSDTEDDVGNGWVTNSENRAGGRKQCFLEDGVLRVVRAKEADHQVSVLHDLEFGDCTVQVRFKIPENDKLVINFNDPGIKKISHAGHVTSVQASTRQLVVNDQMSGSMRLDLRNRRKAGEKSKELKAAFAKAVKKAPTRIKADTWQTLTFDTRGDEVRVFVNGKLGLEFSSPGFGHPTKRNLALSVAKNVEFDYIKVWDEAGQK